MIPLSDPQEFPHSFIEWYIKQTGAKRYLEIGCADGGMTTRAAALCEAAVGVDVNDRKWADVGNVSWAACSSDEFFAQNHQTFDVIFIDGDHSAEQVVRDARNALACLEPDGLVLLHDTYPPDQSFTADELCGTAWEAPYVLKENRRALEVFTFPVTFGLTLVRFLEPAPWL